MASMRNFKTGVTPINVGPIAVAPEGWGSGVEGEGDGWAKGMCKSGGGGRGGMGAVVRVWGTVGDLRLCV